MVNPDRNLYEPPYDDALLYESDLEPERPRSRPLVVLLGIVVLAAFAGVVWVAYNQGVKQGQNGVPTLTADGGPTRVPGDPESPGVAPEKSYDRWLGSAAERETENVLPAPEQPRTMPADETAQGGPDTLKATDLSPPVDLGDPRMDSATGVGIASASPQTIVKAPPSSAARGPAVSEDITAALPPADETAPPAPATATKPAPPKVALAPSKPASTPAPADPAVTDLATPEAAPPPAPASGGSVSIQLGSFPNSGLAASAWSKIKSSNQELLGTYSPTIKPAEIEGKGTWYRLRVGGFADKAAAREVCDQLTANGQACIIAAK
jgi:cell division protein FtsN